MKPATLSSSVRARHEGFEQEAQLRAGAQQARAEEFAHGAPLEAEEAGGQGL
jgi:hypothetical protein